MPATCRHLLRWLAFDVPHIRPKSPDGKEVEGREVDGRADTIDMKDSYTDPTISLHVGKLSCLPTHLPECIHVDCVEQFCSDRTAHCICNCRIIGPASHGLAMENGLTLKVLKRALTALYAGPTNTSSLLLTAAL